MAAPALPPLISSDRHLEVLPERWTPRIPARYRDKAPRTIQLPDGGDALLVEGQEPRPVPFIDLMFATDFPHIECAWPNTRPFAERLFAGVPDDEAFKIAAGNTLAYFGLHDAPVGKKVLAAAPARGARSP